MAEETMLARGAEAVLTTDGSFVSKKRIKKGYRIEEIDEQLRKQRTKSEARMIREARRAGVATPHIIEEKDDILVMSFVPGNRVKEVLNKDNVDFLCSLIGETPAKLHTYNIIHGDLTTSNMIIQNGKLFLIDFGLSFFSSRPEDKAVDLHLLKEALESAHFSIAEKAWETVLKVYKENYADALVVLGSLRALEKRGRYTAKGDKYS